SISSSISYVPATTQWCCGSSVSVDPFDTSTINCLSSKTAELRSDLGKKTSIPHLPGADWCFIFLLPWRNLNATSSENAPTLDWRQLEHGAAPAAAHHGSRKIN